MKLFPLSPIFIHHDPFTIKFQDHFEFLENICTVSIDPDLFLNLLAKEKIKVKPLITSRIPFLQIQEAYELIENKTQEEIKILLTFNK